MMKMKQTLWVLTLLMSACCMSLTGCKPSLPDDVLSQGKMEDILYDYHLALAMVQNEGGDETQRFIYKDAVLRKHDVTRQSSTLLWFTTCAIPTRCTPSTRILATGSTMRLCRWVQMPATRAALAIWLLRATLPTSGVVRNHWCS